jgi:hypothetical protein
MIYIYKSSIKNDNTIFASWNNSDNPIFMNQSNKKLKVANGRGKLHNVGIKFLNSDISYVIIDGIFKNGNIQYGKIMNNNNFFIYEGPFENNIPNGLGIIFHKFKYNNIDYYCKFYGNIKNFCAHGIGKLYDIHNNFLMEVLCIYGQIIRKIDENEDENNAISLLSLSI